MLIVYPDNYYKISLNSYQKNTMSDFSKHKFGTKAIHAGADPDPTTGAIMTPIFQTSTYVQESPGTNKGYGYARGKNPTRTALQTNIAALENGKHA